MGDGDASSPFSRSVPRVPLLLIGGRSFTPRDSAGRRTWTRPPDMGTEQKNKDSEDVRHLRFRLSLGAIAFI